MTTFGQLLDRLSAQLLFPHWYQTLGCYLIIALLIYGNIRLIRINNRSKTILKKYVTDSDVLNALLKDNYAMAIYENDDFTLAWANSQMLDIFGRDKKIIGKPLATALQDAAYHPDETVLKTIYGTNSKPIRKQLVIEEKPVEVVYKPIVDASGQNVGVLQTIANLTHEQALGRRVSSLKQELISIGQELEISYIENDRVNTLLNEALAKVTGTDIESLQNPNEQKNKNDE